MRSTKVNLYIGAGPLIGINKFTSNTFNDVHAFAWGVGISIGIEIVIMENIGLIIENGWDSSVSKYNAKRPEPENSVPTTNFNSHGSMRLGIIFQF